LTGGPAEFAQLVRRYGGDIPAKAMLAELRRLSKVAADKQTVRLLQDREAEQAEKRLLLQAVATISATIRASSDSKPAKSMGSISFREAEVSAPEGVPYRLLSRRVFDTSFAFLQSVRASGDASKAISKAPKKKATRKKRVLVVIVDE
jgi:hypothetical protein